MQLPSMASAITTALTKPRAPSIVLGWVLRRQEPQQTLVELLRVLQRHLGGAFTAGRGRISVLVLALPQFLGRRRLYPWHGVLLQR
jgi:hypothetical protein